MKPKSWTAQEFQEHCLGLTDRFNALFNELTIALCNALKKKKKTPFKKLMVEYTNSRPRRFRVHVDFLWEVARIRNVIAHETTAPRQFPLLPAPMMIEKLQEVVSRLKNPIIVEQRFLKEVSRVSSTTSLIEVLVKMRQKKYSQLPVYDDEKYVGLLTENGISRWLSKQIKTKAGLVDLKGIPVTDVLAQEERRPTCLFVDKAKQVIDIVNLFGDNRELETVIITKDGNENEEPLGIVTRWDITRLRPGRDA
jgi:predicted transcriptional regulator